MITTAMLRKRNMLGILKVVKKCGPLTRPEIARHTKLTSVTVSTLIGELMKNRIVVEEGLYGGPGGGRKAVLYRFNSKAYHIIGVNMRLSKIKVGLYDLDANCVMGGKAVPVTPGQSVENLISEMVASIKALAQAAHNIEIIGIGAAVPGRVDYDRGMIYHLANLKDWVNIPLKSILELETGLPTFIERDVNSHLAYLKWQDALDNEENVVYCDIEEGVGGSLLIDGNVYHGDHGLAGEIGHATLNPDGPLCNCGNHGCVEMYTSQRTLLEYYREALAERGGSTSAYEELMAKDIPEKEKVRQLARLAGDGDEAADRVFLRASKYVVSLLINIINTYDPALIIIECAWLRQHKRYFDSIVSEVFKRTLLLNRNDIKIVLNQIEDIYSESASTIVLEQLFSNIDDNRFIK